MDTSRAWLAGLTLAGTLTGCAVTALPPARDLGPGDLQRLAGTWEWAEPFVSPARLGPGPIRVRIAEGRMRFETATATGSLTLHEGRHRRVLRGEARERVGDRAFPVALRQRLDGAGRATAGTPGVSLVLVE